MEIDGAPGQTFGPSRIFMGVVEFSEKQNRNASLQQISRSKFND